MKVLSEYILGGKKIQNVILNYEELKSIKRHPDNRPDGTDDEYSKFYSESAKKKGAAHRKQVLNSIKTNGFDPTVKIFKIGRYGDNECLGDGQNTRGGVVDYNEEYKRTHNGEIAYNEFQAQITYYSNEQEFKEAMRLMNYAMRKWDLSQFSNLDERIRDIKLEIGERCGLGDKQRLVFIFGDLTSSLYESRTIEQVKTFWREKLDYFSQIVNTMKAKQRANELKVITSTDGFVVLNSLMDRIFNFPSTSEEGFKRASLDEKNEWIKQTMSELVQFFDEVNFDNYNKLLVNNKKSIDGVQLKRKEWYKENLYKLFLSEGKNVFSKKTFECIKEWRNGGKKNLKD